MRRFRIKSLQLAVLLVVVFSSAVPLAYAMITTWQAGAKLTVTEAKKVRVFSDAACTSEVTSIDFGYIEQGQTATTTFYIKNQGSNTVALDWNSDLTSKSNNYIGDAWEYLGSDGNWHNIRGCNLEASKVLTTRYRVVVATTCATGPYSYTLQLGAG